MVLLRPGYSLSLSEAHFQPDDPDSCVLATDYDLVDAISDSTCGKIKDCHLTPERSSFTLDDLPGAAKSVGH